MARPALERDAIVPGGAPGLPSPPGQPQTTGHVLFLKYCHFPEPRVREGTRGGGFTAARGGGEVEEGASPGNLEARLGLITG